MTEACPQHDILTCVTMLREALKASRASGDETAQCAEANSRLHDHLMDYLVQMRRRPLEHIYEFLTPYNGKAPGWYWRHPKASPSDSRNWYGPYDSRKEAIRGRMAQPGALRTPLDVMDREIFGENCG